MAQAGAMSPIGNGGKLPVPIATSQYKRVKSRNRTNPTALDEEFSIRWNLSSSTIITT